MASSNVSSSNNQLSHLPDVGLGNQQTTSNTQLKKPQSTTTSKSTLDTVTLATQNLSISSNDKASLSETSKHTLSPNAPIFVPKSQVTSHPQIQHQQPPNAVGTAKQYHPPQHQQNHHHQKHQNHSKSNYNGSNGASRNRGNQWQTNESSYPPANDDNEFDDYYALAYLVDFINQVSAMPHVYDEEILNLTEILNSCIDEDGGIVLQCAVNNIVDQAIIDPNFRYSGVRLCEHLINNLATNSGITGKVEFKNELVSRCQREHSRRNDLLRSSGDYLRGFTLFVADLSTKLTDEQIFFNALPDLMQVLLSEPVDENVKTVVLAMKLCGRKLESSRNEKFKEIVGRLEVVGKDATSSISNAVTALLELIQRSWAPPPPAAPLANNPYASGVVDDPLPEEYERTYYEDSAYNGYTNYNARYQAPSYDFGNGDEQNSEVADAFEEFLRNSGQLN